MYALFLGSKKKNSKWMLYLILCRLKWVVSNLGQPNRPVVKRIKWVGSGQSALSTGQVMVEGS